MSSKFPRPRDAYVWTWLPGASEPVVAGRLVPQDGTIAFNYGRSYRERPDAIPLYLPELPIGAGLIRPKEPLSMAGAIRDAAPDAWGRRVIINRVYGARGNTIDALDLDELVYLLESGSDRIGALDFQASASKYVPRGHQPAMLDELLEAADRVERNLPLTPELDTALYHGSSIGGARPKALIVDGPRKYIAKFASGSDTYNIVKGEFVAMRLAVLAGIDAAPVKLTRSAGKDVLLVERFDRTRINGDWHRRAMVSALTMLELGELQARYASYEDLAEIVRFRFTNVTNTLREVFARLVFNILVGNTDDHARNHAAFWDGTSLALTPAYDICPQTRVGEEATQAMLVTGQDRSSRLLSCLAAAASFRLDADAAFAIIERQLRAIGDNWRAVCDDAALGPVDRALLWGRSFINPYAFYGLDGRGAELGALAQAYRSETA